MGWLSKAKAIANAIKKHGPKAWDAIKKGAGSVYNSAKAAWDKGFWSFVWWLVEHTSTLGIIYDALQKAGLL
ncbi:MULTISPECIES: hypothetical protein [Thermoactinomycetaceae]|uniref:Uncharacterized protein n=2 Tax=Thermoactinomycetaceae TaxID=186824 RepID=A0A4R2SAV1_9BACL|nr:MULTISPECIES: hypothetical protein [Thermoactinomycetaceae]MDQ0416703.1 hypothetical protein [Croceifilum oryzae]TCP68345.1 hypothetical protein EDD57_11732 [Baia soyae]